MYYRKIDSIVDVLSYNESTFLHASWSKTSKDLLSSRMRELFSLFFRSADFASRVNAEIESEKAQFL